jgi:hypothetical protein
MLGAASALLILLALGCRSRFVAVSIENDTGQPLQMVELDYPGASFGVSTLAPHAVYSYRFKAIGSGALALSYSEAGSAHTSAGPPIGDAVGGTLHVLVRERGVVNWDPSWIVTLPSLHKP